MRSGDSQAAGAPLFKLKGKSKKVKVRKRKKQKGRREASLSSSLLPFVFL
jgi:hypothetical protein